MTNVPELSRDLLLEHKTVAEAAAALEAMALADPVLYTELTKHALRDSCLSAIRRVQIAAKNKFTPKTINTTIVEERQPKDVATPRGAGRPRIVSYQLMDFFSVNKKPLGDATKLDILSHIGAQTKRIKTQIHSNVWLTKIADQLNDTQTVRQVFSEDRLTQLKAESTVDASDLESYTSEEGDFVEAEVIANAA